jgi:hypothetical protein
MEKGGYNQNAVTLELEKMFSEFDYVKNLCFLNSIGVKQETVILLVFFRKNLQLRRLKASCSAFGFCLKYIELGIFGLLPFFENHGSKCLLKF